MESIRDPCEVWAPGSRIHASPRAWLAGSEQPRRLQDKKKPFFFPSITLSQKSNIGKSTCHVSCLYFEGKAIKLTKLKLSAKYAFLQAPSNLKNRLAGSRGDSRTGLQGLWQSKYGPTEFQGSRGRPTGSHMAQEWARGSQGVMW